MLKTRRSHAVCEGPLGFPMRESAARKVEALLEVQPKGPEWEYRRTGSAPTALELVEGERCDVSVISTPTLDRDREIVVAGGIDLMQFRSNPVVTFAHRYDELPVGKALWIKHEGERLEGEDAIHVQAAGVEGRLAAGRRLAHGQARRPQRQVDRLSTARWRSADCGRDRQAPDLETCAVGLSQVAASRIRRRPGAGESRSAGGVGVEDAQSTNSVSIAGCALGWLRGNTRAGTRRPADRFESRRAR